MSDYVVIFERGDDGGWGAYLPDLPGVVALGTTRGEVSDRIREAVDAYAEEMAALGQRLPDPVAATGTIRRPDSGGPALTAGGGTTRRVDVGGAALLRLVRGSARRWPASSVACGRGRR